MYPGLTEFTLMSGEPGRDPHSAARDRVICRTADFDAL